MKEELTIKDLIDSKTRALLYISSFRRIIETFLIFTLTPITTLLLIILRYHTEGIIGTQVTIDMMYIGGLMIFIAIILAITFGNILKNDTKMIIENINTVKSDEYNNCNKRYVKVYTRRY